MWRLYVIAFGLVFAYWWINIQYQAVKKYYPNMTFMEYLILEDKIRITPDGD